MTGKRIKPLDRIIDNAFDFLETAIEEFDTKPKYSIMHFCTAVELVLKARLVHEHWSLIVADKPEKSKFEKGDFRSITIKESIEKIRNVLGDDFPENFQESFLNIANHRNKLVHFFHDEVGKKKIAREQCTGWFYLSRLINKWDNTFSKYQDKIAELNKKMRKYHDFLATTYEEAKSDINKEKLSGAIFKVCPSCQFEACKQSTITDNIYIYKCKVCIFEEKVIIIPCSNCDEPIEISEGDGEPIRCLHCNHEIDPAYLSEQLDTNLAYGKDHNYMKINCAYCCTSGSVVTHNGYYICAECHSISEDVGSCDWCSEGQIGGGDLEFSFLDGCEFCEGHAGHTGND